MVTLEQKLALFSKLLHQDIKEDIDKKLAELDKEYGKRIAISKDKADKEVNTIIENAMKRAEAKKIELVSKGKIAAKREEMLTKERYINIFMDHLKDKVKIFVQSEPYRIYLKQYLIRFKDLKDYANDLMVYMTAQDYKEHKDYIEEILVSIGLDAEKLKFEVTNDNILGGIIIEDPKLNMRIDESIIVLLEDSKRHIIETVFTTIGEVGETLG